MNSRYHDADPLVRLAGIVGRVLRELAEARAELASRKQGCSCRWAPESGLMPNPGCPAHGVEASDLLTLGRAARESALRLMYASRVTP